MVDINTIDSNIQSCEICHLQNVEENMIQRFDKEGEYYVCEDCEIEDIAESLKEQ